MKNNSLGLISRIPIRRRLNYQRKQVVNPDDLHLFDEVALCLLAGAYRSAYITVWLCAAASIRSKLETISSRDSHVGRKLGEIDKAEQDSSPIDKMLLQSALDFGMIVDEDHLALGNIRRMRNVYAHPRRSAPSPDEVLGALGTITRALLSQPPFLRHGYASDIIRGVFEERHFLDDIEERIHDFGEDFARRLDQSVHPWVFSEIISNLEAIWDDPTMLARVSRSIAFAEGFLTATSPALMDDDWRIVEHTRSSPRSSSVILANPDVWQSLPLQAREIIIGHLCESIGQPTSSRLRRSSGTGGPLPSQAFSNAKNLLDSNLLNDREEERIKKAIGSAPIERLAQFEVPITEWFEPLIDELTTYNWYHQNPAVNAVMSAGPDQVSLLETSEEELLGRNILQAADGGSNSAEYFMRSISESPEDWPSRFVAGLLFECFLHDSGACRTKTRMIPFVVEIILGRQDLDAASLIDELNQGLDGTPFKEDEFADFEFESAATIIQAHVSKFKDEDGQVLQEVDAQLSTLNDILGELSSRSSDRNE